MKKLIFIFLFVAMQIANAQSNFWKFTEFFDGLPLGYQYLRDVDYDRIKDAGGNYILVFNQYWTYNFKEYEDVKQTYFAYVFRADNLDIGSRFNAKLSYNRRKHNSRTSSG